ncbi:DUF1192 domain-containing protein [Novosphingobium sp.]|uniref:DUF1192 domain-containing protein n=1 Tax=Novosphingobium sp. TaxID=1874826 RepID=UPI003B52191E
MAMDGIDLPRPTGDLASKLAMESLDHLSVDELGDRIALLETEIARTAAHRDKARTHRLAADSLFNRPKSS